MFPTLHRASIPESTPSSDRPVLLVEWNRDGHHGMYLALYAAALLRQGRRVGVLCPAPDELRGRLRDEPGASAGRLVIAEAPSWQRRRSGKPGAFARGWWAWRTRSAARAVERALGGGPCLVHLMCLYEHEARCVSALRRVLGRPWTALYMHARAGLGAAGRSGRPHVITSLWRCPRLRGLLVLNEEALAPHAFGGGWPVRLAPDLTDASTEPGHVLGAEARGFAAGRPLVGLLGYLLPSKGVAALATVAARDDASDLAFLFAGEMPLERFTRPDDLAAVDAARARASGARFHAARLPAEADYNALFAACDVVCATYRDFPHSSNTLTKAAVFERPVIVSEGHLMARRVREFGLGEVVAQDDPVALLAAIRRITGDPAAWRSSRAPRWREYRELHSAERLAEVLSEFFGPGAAERP